MSGFVVTPTYADNIQNIVKDPVTGKWYIPKLVIHYDMPNNVLNSINEDPSYRHKVIEYFYTKLTEKWLFGNPSYQSLIKYFRAKKMGDRVEVEIIPYGTVLTETEKNDQKELKHFIFKFIEKHFATKSFVRDSLEKLVRQHNVRWFDMYQRNSEIKDFLRRQLKKTIKQTTQEISWRN